MGCGRSESTDEAHASDRTVRESSAWPKAVDVSKVGTYPERVHSGAGYFYDDVLEYRVWMHPEDGAANAKGGNDYFIAFAQYEVALEYSKAHQGAEKPLVLIRQLQHVNEPKPDVFEVIDGERLTEWQVEWLEGAKRTPEAVERFLREQKR